MITNHDEEIISEIADFNTLTLVTAAYTLYEKLSTKKPISKREFYKEFGDNFQSFKKNIFRRYRLKISTTKSP